jgi:hypothetical protein
VSNAPHVVSPAKEYAYRDAGETGDAFSERLVRETPAYLVEGGTATLMVSWLERGEAPGERAAAWIAGAGCDAWVLSGRSFAPLEYAAYWNHRSFADEARYGADVRAWIGYLESLGASGVTQGAVLLRRRSGGENWIRTGTMGPGLPPLESDDADGGGSRRPRPRT